ncbi:MAG TPA: peptide-methionine (R)-S-oxide reductase MsrB [Nevskiaceae bacterium]|nr:peptide-methionine (R)-S-oxide reductase MsrB [Nevskiaceae bacterium]
MTRRNFLQGLIGSSGAAALGAEAAAPPALAKTPAEWKTLLSPEQYRILRDHGTERAGTSALNKEKRDGTYCCAGCFLPLFDSSTKYESGTGWPSFWQPLPEALGTQTDRSFFMVRTEYHCKRCQGHQGHVFEDGPPPTGLRYCNNGLALRFVPRGEPLPVLRS